MMPRLLDLFCGAGGAAMGYHQAGFDDIVGVDIKPMKRYPFTFVQGDALEYVAIHGHEFDAIHASPPCQAYSKMSQVNNNEYADLVAVTRAALIATNKPYVIENVPGAPLINPLTLCGTMFGLKVIRHRLFESSPVIWFPPATCRHDTGGMKKAGRGPSPNGFWSIAGKGGGYDTKRGWQKAMGINWMILTELAQAIPPAYTKFIGGHLRSR